MKKYKRFLSLLLTLCMVLSMIPGTAFAAGSTMPFTDVRDTDWFHDAVQYVYENDMMSGTGEETFSPDLITTRGMIVTILYKMEGRPAAAGKTFADVDQSQYYAMPVAWASENDIVSGYGSGMFGPNDPITREQLVVILYHYAQYKGYDVSVGENTNILSYTDFNQLSEWAIPAMQWACGAGLVSGMGDGTLAPKGSATRAQAAAVLMCFCENVAGTAETYTVIFDLNYTGGGSYKTAEVKSGETISAPTNPSRSGYSFSGWYTKATGGSKFDFDTVITGDVTLYAQWSRKTSSGSISSDGGNGTQPPADEGTTPEEYYEDIAELIDVIPVEDSDSVLTETEVKSFLEERGFDDYPITYQFLINGEDVGETEILDGSTDTHPMYQTFYLSENSEVWTVYVINGDIFAYPASFNLESDLGAELLVSESEKLTSYYKKSNKFYVTIPYESAAIVIVVDRIDAEALDALCIEEICRLSGATPPAADDEGDIIVADDSLEASDGVALAAFFDDEIALTTAGTTRAADDPVIIVSLGDSYSSGEGIEPFYGQNKSLSEKVKDENWLAHRSTLAWPSLLEIPGIAGTTGNYLGSTSSVCQWYFAAASGARTKHFKKQQNKDYCKKFSDGITLIPHYLSGSQKLPAQLSIFETNDLKGKVDYVTLTIGGNDVGFSDIIMSVAVNSSYLNIYWLADPIDEMMAELWANFDTTRADIKQAYENIEYAAGEQAAIIVAGYPKLLDKNGEGFAISKEEAVTINTNVTKFNIELKNLVKECSDSEMNIYFVDVEDVFDGHEAFSNQAWINPIWLGAKPQDIDDLAIGSAYSMHPNELGAQAYARCVNEKIAEIENSKTISGVITIADADTDMTNNVPLEGATVKITEKNADSIARTRRTTSDSSGAYALTGILKGTYVITVSKEGYIPVTEIITVGEGASEIIYNITIEAISEAYGGTGCASGTIYDVGTGLPVSGLTLYIRAGLENTVGDVISTISMDNGVADYTTAELPAGNYTVQIVDERTGITEEERYITSAFNIKVLGGMTIGDQNGYVSNGVTSDELRIVLTWGSTPSDLDSHLVGPTADDSKFHVYYGDKTYGFEADLDVDDTSSYGPETVTIHSFNEGIYTYAVHDYTNKNSSYSTAMANSGAQVKVYRGAELIATYNVPANMDGTLWTVFTYNSVTRQITTVNKMSYDSTSGGSLMSVSLLDEYLLEPYGYEDAIAILTQDIFDTTKK